jgi:hypothetical protein
VCGLRHGVRARVRVWDLIGEPWKARARWGRPSGQREGAVPGQLHLPRASAAVLSTDISGSSSSGPPAEVETCQQVLMGTRQNVLMGTCQKVRMGTGHALSEARR